MAYDIYNIILLHNDLEIQNYNSLGMEYLK